MATEIQDLLFMYWLEKYLPESQFKKLGMSNAFLKELKLARLPREGVGDSFCFDRPYH